MKKFFLASCTVRVRNEIYGISQKNKTPHEYWKLFKCLCKSFSHHYISDALLIQYFYEGLVSNDRSTIGAAAREASVNMTPREAITLIFTMTTNGQQFETRDRVPLSTTFCQEVSEFRYEVTELNTLVK